jgi:hypothetical protein
MVARKSFRRILMGVALVLVVVAGAGLALVMAPSEHKTATTVAAQPQPVRKSPIAAAKPSQSPTRTASTVTLPDGVPAEQAPADDTKSIKVGSSGRIVYPSNWMKPINPDGVKDGSDGEVHLVQPNGGLVQFFSTKSPIGRQLYGNDPVGWWKGHTCAGDTLERKTGPVAYSVQGMDVVFYTRLCGSGEHNFLWYARGSGMVASATDGADGTYVNAHTVTWTFNHVER